MFWVRLNFQKHSFFVPDKTKDALIQQRHGCFTEASS